MKRVEVERPEWGGGGAPTRLSPLPRTIVCSSSHIFSYNCFIVAFVRSMPSHVFGSLCLYFAMYFKNPRSQFFCSSPRRPVAIASFSVAGTLWTPPPFLNTYDPSMSLKSR